MTSWPHPSPKRYAIFGRFLRRFTTIISAWWLQTSSKFSSKKSKKNGIFFN